MDSKPKLTQAAWWIAAVAITSAALFLGNGLEPRWWLMWIAPLPVLLLAPRANRLPAFGAAALAWILGGLNVWSYYQDLRLPPGVLGMAIVAPGIVFGTATLLWRLLIRRGSVWAAAVSLPLVWVVNEFIGNYANGTYTNLAYTQMDCLPLLQLGSVTGIWGISFVILLIPSAAAAIWWRYRSGSSAAPLALATVAVMTGVMGFGWWRVQHYVGGPSVPVGLIVSDLPQNRNIAEPPDAMRLLREYESRIGELVRRGARIVLLPEMTAVVLEKQMPEVDELFGLAARKSGIQILVPIIHVTTAGPFNEARLYSKSGTLEAAYRKHHLVPVFEDRTLPGREITVLKQQYGVIGIEICKDMDYLKLARRYEAEHAGLMLVPAWDFVQDAWLHGRMALMRGVENGFHIARVAKGGTLTVSDTRGRVLAEAASSAAPFSTLVAPAGTAHVQTLYAAWGDWFAWLCVAGLGIVLIHAMTLRGKPVRPL